MLQLVSFRLVNMDIVACVTESSYTESERGHKGSFLLLLLCNSISQATKYQENKIKHFAQKEHLLYLFLIVCCIYSMLDCTVTCLRHVHFLNISDRKKKTIVIIISTIKNDSCVYSWYSRVFLKLILSKIDAYFKNILPFILCVR